MAAGIFTLRSMTDHRPASRPEPCPREHVTRDFIQTPCYPHRQGLQRSLGLQGADPLRGALFI